MIRYETKHIGNCGRCGRDVEAPVIKESKYFNTPKGLWIKIRDEFYNKKQGLCDECYGEIYLKNRHYKKWKEHSLIKKLR